jgi:hypothetical protein
MSHATGPSCRPPWVMSRCATPSGT